MVFQQAFSVATTGRGSYSITAEIQRLVKQSAVHNGICHLFLRHTSASLMLCENADPDVRDDLERFMSQLVPDGDALFEHTAEGPDDMPAHVRSVLTHSDLSLPVTGGRCSLGTWQGVYLWEHRLHGFHREITLTVYGD